MEAAAAASASESSVSPQGQWEAAVSKIVWAWHRREASKIPMPGAGRSCVFCTDVEDWKRYGEDMNALGRVAGHLEDILLGVYEKHERPAKRKRH